MLILLVIPVMQVCYTRGHQLCYKEHVVNFQQNIANIAQKLPQLPHKVDMVIIRCDGVDLSQHVDFVVRWERVRQALQYLTMHNPYYTHLYPNKEALSQLPENGTVAHLILTCREGIQVQDAANPAGPIEAARVPEGNSQGAEDDILEPASLGDEEQQVSGVVNLGNYAQPEVVEVRQQVSEVLQNCQPQATQTIVCHPPSQNYLT